ncbi:DUF3014 domain-containing protein [bacterium]|nr:DUF3014 domain-containing protein [bacterium]
MEENKKVLVTGIIFILVVALGFAVYFFVIQKKPQPPAEKVTQEPSLPPVQKEDKKLPKKEEPVETLDVPLSESDELVRQKAQKISSHTLFERWLGTSRLVRKFTAAVDNIAHGLSPREQIDFFKPEEGFQVVEREGRVSIDPASYRRYDPVVEVFVSLDTQQAVRLYRRLKPTIQEAYAELGYPNTDFNETLSTAIKELLEVPIIEGNVLLEKKVMSYRLADPDLENMSEAQKHLFRMGPQNIKRIQDKLREIALALGIKDNQLPSESS